MYMSRGRIVPRRFFGGGLIQVPQESMGPPPYAFSFQPRKRRRPSKLRQVSLITLITMKFVLAVLMLSLWESGAAYAPRATAAPVMA